MGPCFSTSSDAPNSSDRPRALTARTSSSRQSPSRHRKNKRVRGADIPLQPIGPPAPAVEAEESPPSVPNARSSFEFTGDSAQEPSQLSPGSLYPTADPMYASLEVIASQDDLFRTVLRSRSAEKLLEDRRVAAAEVTSGSGPKTPTRYRNPSASSHTNTFIGRTQQTGKGSSPGRDISVTRPTTPVKGQTPVGDNAIQPVPQIPANVDHAFQGGSAPMTPRRPTFEASIPTRRTPPVALIEKARNNPPLPLRGLVESPDQPESRFSWSSSEDGGRSGLHNKSTSGGRPYDVRKPRPLFSTTVPRKGQPPSKQAPKPKMLENLLSAQREHSSSEGTQSGRTSLQSSVLEDGKTREERENPVDVQYRLRLSQELSREPSPAPRSTSMPSAPVTNSNLIPDPKETQAQEQDTDEPEATRWWKDSMAGVPLEYDPNDF